MASGGGTFPDNPFPDVAEEGMTEEEVRAASADWKAGFKAGWVESAMSAVSLDDMPESVRLENAA